MEEEGADGEHVSSELNSFDPTTCPVLPVQHYVWPRRAAVEMAYGDDTYLYGFTAHLAALHAAVVWRCCGRSRASAPDSRFRGARVVSARASPSW